MIITRTPFRISLCGGGTDFPEFYHHEFGCVVSMAIDKYMYITVNKKFSGGIRVAYSKTEFADEPSKIEHPIARESLKSLSLTGVEITSNADLPANTGLGSSGSFTVGLIHALHSYKGEQPSAETLAHEAYHIERHLASQLTGKQDHFIAAYGGLRYIEFNQDDTVYIKHIYYSHLAELNRNLMLVYTGPRKIDVDSIQKQLIAKSNLDALGELKKLAIELREALFNKAPPEVVAEFLSKDWEIRRKLAKGVSTPEIDHYYAAALEAGALGGKLCGAGNGGFLLLYCPSDKQQRVSQTLGLRVVPFRFEHRGSEVIFFD